MTLNGVPNDLIQNINPIFLVVFIPIFDQVLYPFLRSRKIRLTPIRKIVCGYACACFAMIWATIVQLYIYRKSPCGNQANNCEIGPAPINVWAQTGSYALISFSEIFASITILEYAFTKAPKNMRSIVQALSLLTNAVSSALGQALSPLADDPLLVWNYVTCTLLAFVGGVLFFLTFRGLDRQEEVLNELPEGHVWVKEDIPEEEMARTGTRAHQAGAQFTTTA